MAGEGPLDGIRVVEVANWLAAPSAAALMADMGADVVKVEPPGGDAFRGFNLRSTGIEFDFATNYGFQLDNRGKRSITLALDRPGASEVVHRLIERADVFVTNLQPERRRRYRLAYADAVAVNPRIVYAGLTGYGQEGPDAHRPGFDYAAFWARSGLMGLSGEPPSPPPMCRGGQGDHTTCLNILAAVLAALRLRDRTGEPQEVEVTLQATGMWTLGTDMAAALAAHQQPERHERTTPSNPIWNSYQCGDGRWLLLVMPVPDPVYWPRFCRALGRPEWADTPAYATMEDRREHGRELADAIGVELAGHDRDHWAARFDAEGLIWAPVATLPEVIADPQVAAMGWVVPVEHEQYGRFETLRAPFIIRGADVRVRGRAPEPGEHTFDVLTELGVSGDDLDRLAGGGALG
jgi:crotonobetainyl-CoA:carnitine CoA-transferase CaiB-like acyl-CoA transferase